MRESARRRVKRVFRVAAVLVACAWFAASMRAAWILANAPGAPTARQTEEYVNKGRSKFVTPGERAYLVTLRGRDWIVPVGILSAWVVLQLGLRVEVIPWEFLRPRPRRGGRSGAGETSN